jgi:hypothetical protein
MKKALAGPAKPTAKKKPERRAMIAAKRRRIGAAPQRARKRLRRALPGPLEATRRLDRAVDRQLQRTSPAIRRVGRSTRAAGVRLGRRLRPLSVLLLRGLALLERRLLGALARARRAATRASAVLTPQRAICLTILASAACLIASQFVEYRAVEIDQPGYAGLAAVAPPKVDARTAGEAHAYLLIPVALLAAALALAALRNERRRGLGRIVFVLGLLSLAVALLIDLPAGLDAGAQTSRFAAATAVIYDGFYAQIAAACGLMLGGALLSRARKPRLARTQGGRRSARTLFVRKQGGRPRTQPDEGLQRPAATMRGRA